MLPHMILRGEAFSKQTRILKTNLTIKTSQFPVPLLPSALGMTPWLGRLGSSPGVERSQSVAILD